MATRGRKRDVDQQVPPVDEGKMLDRGQMKSFKYCTQCKRPMVQRAKWSDPRVWAEVKYCSDGCRKASKSSSKAPQEPQQREAGP